MIALPILALLGLLVPTYHDVALRLWKFEEHAYAPLLAALSSWLIWYRFRQIKWAPGPGVPIFGLSLLAAGAGVYVVGRSQQIELLELGACIPIIAGVLAILGGRLALHNMRIPLLFLLFSLPYPGWLIDSLTSPLKEMISIWSEAVLYAAGYPIAREGVILGLGPYRLLVADACSGLHSLIFLSALGLLYIHLTGQRSHLHRCMLVAALLPIAVFANFVRVLILLLLTYHFGDAVGQGYWHDLAGLFLFVTALATLTGFDRLLSPFSSRNHTRPLLEAQQNPATTASGVQSWRRSLMLSFALLATAVASILLTPTRFLVEKRPALDLEAQIPQSFGDWVKEDLASTLLVAPALQTEVQRTYSQTISRIYINSQDQRIMLSIAYGENQMGNELQVHRPEYCYKAQGFSLIDSNKGQIATASGDLAVRRLVARQHNRIEPITYWITVGETTALPGMYRKLAQLRYGLQGKIPDGMVIRISSLDSDTENAFRLHEAFITAMETALPKNLGYIVARPVSG